MDVRMGRLAIALLSSATFFLASPSAHADPRELIGRAAPEVRARPLDSDEAIDMSSYRGRVTLVLFVATWCRSCRRMAPRIEALYEAQRARGLEVIAFSNEPRDRIREHQRLDPRSYTVAQCTGRTSLRWHARALPTIVLVDRQGVVRGAYAGAAPEVIERVRRDVDRWLAAP
jgi:thiol-disulfide isomerase/thioredoxin